MAFCVEYMRYENWFELTVRGWRDSSVERVFAGKAQGLILATSEHMVNSRSCAVTTRSPSIWEG